MSTVHEPLHFPAAPPDTFSERVRRFFQDGIVKTPRAKSLLQQLESRSTVTLEAWGNDPARQRLAIELSRIIRDEIGWPNAYFVPDDPFEIVVFNVRCDGSFYDNMEIENVFARIEEFIVEDLGEDTIGRLYDMTYGEAVDELLRIMKRG